jgi:hypothetical protein
LKTVINTRATISQMAMFFTILFNVPFLDIWEKQISF